MLRQIRYNKTTNSDTKINSYFHTNCRQSKKQKKKKKNKERTETIQLSDLLSYFSGWRYIQFIRYD